MKKALYIIYKNRYLIIVTAVFLFVVFVYFRCTDGKASSLSVEKNNEIGLTAEEITSIKNIKQWEFLSMQTEELVDTTEKQLIKDRQLVRIYRGTLRLGTDLTKTDNDWIKWHGDTVSIKLPAITLLDTNFIDEANTTTFYEEGRWSAAAKEALYRRARRNMIKRVMTQLYIDQAENNARRQFTRLFQAYGFRTVEFR